MVSKEGEIPEIPLLELDQTIIPYRDIQSPDQLLREYQFVFDIGSHLVEGGVQINIGDSFAYSDDAPALYPFPIKEDEGYQIDMEDTELNLRYNKISEERSARSERNIRNLLHRLTNNLPLPPKLSCILFDNDLMGFMQQEQELLRQIDLVVIFDEHAAMRAAVGKIFFPEDLKSTSPNHKDALMRQNALTHPVGKNTKGRIPFGRIASFIPGDISSLASNDAQTDIYRNRIGTGHPIQMPGDLDLIRFTQFRFVQIPS